jgi:hypothetical protein
MVSGHLNVGIHVSDNQVEFVVGGERDFQIAASCGLEFWVHLANTIKTSLLVAAVRTIHKERLNKFNKTGLGSITFNVPFKVGHIILLLNKIIPCFLVLLVKFRFSFSSHIGRQSFVALSGLLRHDCANVCRRRLVVEEGNC